MRFAVFVLGLFVLPVSLLVAPAGATIWTVNPLGTGDFPTIQAAIDAAATGDVIELTDGTFRGAGNRDLSTLGKTITIRSRSGDPTVCILDPTAAAPPGEDHKAFRIENAEGPSTRIEALTVTHGQAGFGGACFFSGASPTLVNCRFIANGAPEGGVVYCFMYASPTFVGCQFEQNNSDHGGAVYCYYYTAPVFDHCTFYRNEAYTSGGVGYLADHDTPTFTSCTFAANGTLTSHGGAFVFLSQSLLQLDHCIMTHTYDIWTALYGQSSSAQVTCTDYWQNEGGSGGFIQPGVNGNISEDPLYCGLSQGDLRIDASSPCTPGQNPECGLIGALPVGCDNYAAVDAASLPERRMHLWAESPVIADRVHSIAFDLPGLERTHVMLDIHDVQGRKVCTLVDEELSAGQHTYTWDGSSDHGRSLAPGVYYLRLESKGAHLTRSLVLIQ